MNLTPQVIEIEGGFEIIEVGQQGPIGPPGTTNPQSFNVTYASNIVIDWSLGDIAILTLTGNTTVSMIGTRKKSLLVVRQDATGSRLITWDSLSVGFGTDIPSVLLSQTPNKTDYLGFAYNSVSGKQDLVGFSRGY